MAAPLYLFTGFLDSGKSTLINDTLSQPGFLDDDSRTLLISFEEGEVEYDETFLDEHRTFLVQMDDVSDLTMDKVLELDSIYHPTQIFIEYNGSEPITDFFLRDLNDIWPLVEVLSTVDATTFNLYIANMRSILYEQLRFSDIIIVNRCVEDTDAMMIRGNLKAINRVAQIFYEGEFGEPANIKGGTLPFNIDDEVIHIKDDDYGLWYMDAMEDPAKYDGKKMVFKGEVTSFIPGYNQSFIMGRRAMVCCENDTSVCGFTVTGVKVEELNLGDWVEVEGTMKLIPVENNGQTIILYASKIQLVTALKDPYIYFN